MNIDFGNSVIDVAIALSFAFFLLSLVASAVREFFAGVFGLRTKNLVKGLEGMLGDAVVAEKVMEHPLVQTELGKGKGLYRPATGRLAWLKDLFKRGHGPSYISSRNFAIALKAALKEVPEAAQNLRLKQQIEALSHEFLPNSPPPVTSVEKWFNDSMERVSGWYKRHSQYWMAAIAVVIAVGLNASAIRLVERFESEPTLRAAVVKQAEKTVEKGEFAKEKAKGDPVKQIENAGTESGKALDQIEELKLPLMWSGVNAPHSAQDWLTDALGWLITAIAVSLGAPFWFDSLGKLANLRMAGKNPEEKEKAKA